MSRENATKQLHNTPAETPPAVPARTSRTREKTGNLPRLTLSKAEAAASLGVSVDFFEDHVLADLRVVRRGRLVLIPVRELERWVDSNATTLWGAG